jgi:type VI secretion system protein ImpK
MTPNIPVAPSRPENIALIFQELLTAIERLRSNRQPVADAEAFRQQIREALKTAVQTARDRGGYSPEDIRMATLAVVGFLDETILTLQSPVFGNWPRRPLQEELFGTHLAGEIFFENLRQLLGRENTLELGDLLEVHYLCLLLGFRGRYSLGDRGEIRSVLNETGDRIRRIRGSGVVLSPDWAPAEQAVQVKKDPWSRRLLFGAAACMLLTILLFVLYKMLLTSGTSAIQNMAI